MSLQGARHVVLIDLLRATFSDPPRAHAPAARRICDQDGDKDAVPKERVKHMLDKYDTDRNGTIEENEFIDMMKGTIQDIDMDAQILEAFKIFADKARLLSRKYIR